MRPLDGCLAPTRLSASIGAIFLFGPFDRPLKVRVPQEFPCQLPPWELNEYDLQSSGTGARHDRHAIRMAISRRRGSAH